MPEIIARARVGGVRTFGRAIRSPRGVVGAGDKNIVTVRVDGAAFRTVHFGRAEQIRGKARVDQHGGLIGHAVTGRQRAAAMHQRQPDATAAFIEARHVERAVIEHGAVGRSAAGFGCGGSHKFVQILEALIVTEIKRDAAIGAGMRHCRLVLEAAHCSALDRHRERIIRINLDHPAKAVGLIGRAAKIKARIQPEMRIGRATDAIALLLRCRLVRCGGAKHHLKIFFAREVSAPWRPAVGAIHQRTQYGCAAGLLRGFHQAVPGRRAGDGARCRRRNAPPEP